ncbi:MAG: AraC family transcriptional regulator, partial [Bacteroidota bacterium]
MKITIEIKESRSQLEQMAAQLGIPPVDGLLQIPPVMGEGFCRLYSLPYGIQLHHYQYCLNRQVEVQSINEVDTGMYILNINLSQKLLDKQIEDRQHWLSREGKSGVLFYSPGNNSKGKNEINLPFEVVFFSIPQRSMQQFLDSLHSSSQNLGSFFCHYAELDDELTQELLDTLRPKEAQNLFFQQGKLLEILGKILSLFYREAWRSKSSGLKLPDVELLLQVKAMLNSHLYGSAPTIDELARQVNMSPSQLKSKFKSLLGHSIYQYYLKSKLSEAKRLLEQRTGTV